VADLTRAGARETVAAVRAGELRARALAAACLSAIDERGGDLNCFTAVTRERALRDAGAVDEAVDSGRDPGPLAGMTVAVKATFDIEGLPTHAGTAFLGETARRDAALVSSLVSLGAVVVGQAGMHELAYGSTSDNPHYGAVRNPADPTRIPGGSSGGSAAAVGAGLCHVALGTDTAGSIRAPAGFCGVVGIKPGRGVLPLEGCLPLARSLDHAGVFARTCADADCVMDALGFDPPEGGRLSLALPRGEIWERGDPQALSALRAALERAARRGVGSQDVDLTAWNASAAAALLLIAGESTTEWVDALRRHRGDLGADVRVNLVSGLAVEDSALQTARRLRPALAEAFMLAMGEATALAVPAMPVAPPPLGQQFLDYGPGGGEIIGLASLRVMGPGNATGLPAVCVPAASLGGLPLGLQLIGRPGSERELLRLGGLLSDARDDGGTRDPDR
jgi:Asp-tRNA(Asn)/Glu-tRNA(Gln) amidotransferase A subunit family amidase